MASALCPRCHEGLPLLQYTGQGEVCTCLRCRTKVRLAIFPALLKDNTAPPPLEAPLEPGEVACFYSPTRRATAECGHCGVMVSPGWSAQWGESTVCLKCLEHLRMNQKDTRFETKRILWDNVCLGLALLPCTFIFYFVAPVSAPAAIILGFWNWKKPRSILPRGPWRMLLALLLALTQVVLMILGGIAIFETMTRISRD